jgi:hypothetical protein
VLSCAYHTPAFGKHRVLWVISASSSGYRTSPFVMSLNVPPHSFPPNVVRVVGNLAVCHQLIYFFLIFSLLPNKCRFVLFLLFQIYFVIHIFFNLVPLFLISIFFPSLFNKVLVVFNFIL